MPRLATTSPRTTLARIRRLCNLTVAGIWLFQGIVPKLLGPHADEIAMAEAFGIAAEFQAPVSYAAGAAEVLLGLCIVAFPRRAWPQVISAAVTALLLAFVALYVPRYLIGAFNPVVMNTASIVLSVVAVMALRAEPATGARPPPRTSSVPVHRAHAGRRVGKRFP